MSIFKEYAETVFNVEETAIDTKLDLIETEQAYIKVLNEKKKLLENMKAIDIVSNPTPTTTLMKQADGKYMSKSHSVEWSNYIKSIIEASGDFGEVIIERRGNDETIKINKSPTIKKTMSNHPRAINTRNKRSTAESKGKSPPCSGERVARSKKSPPRSGEHVARSRSKPPPRSGEHVARAKRKNHARSKSPAKRKSPPRSGERVARAKRKSPSRKSPAKRKSPPHSGEHIARAKRKSPPRSGERVARAKRKRT